MLGGLAIDISAQRCILREVVLRDKPAAAPAAGLPMASAPGDQVVPMDRMRGIIAHHMVESIQTSAHVYIMTECDMTDVVGFRKKHKDAFEELKRRVLPPTATG